ncbi:MAG: Maf family protein [Deltaproteobacteria bacterium]|nr:Maf family protein [Deltaproteobacteria bacterium]
MKFILGSSSPRRKELLKKYGLRFTVLKPGIDEIPKKGETPEDFVKRAACDKLNAIIKKPGKGVIRDRVIITADTIVVLKRKILGKPRDEKEAFLMLKSLQNRWHIVYTCFCIYYKGRRICKLVKTSVRFRPLSDKEIKEYISSGEPMDKAGAYAAQDKGASIIKEIKGSYTNVVGLPMAELIDELKKLKIQPEF